MDEPKFKLVRIKDGGAVAGGVALTAADLSRIMVALQRAVEEYPPAPGDTLHQDYKTTLEKLRTV